MMPLLLSVTVAVLLLALLMPVAALVGAFLGFMVAAGV